MGLEGFTSKTVIIMSIWGKGWMERIHPTRCGTYGLGWSGEIIWRKPDHIIILHYFVSLKEKTWLSHHKCLGWPLQIHKGFGGVS
jgi:hypothetical protein